MNEVPLPQVRLKSTVLTDVLTVSTRSKINEFGKLKTFKVISLDS